MNGGDVGAALARIAAPGTDPERLWRLVGWLVRHGDRGESLRRACRDGGLLATPHGLLDARLTTPRARDRDLAARAVEAWDDLGVRAAVVGDPAYPAQLAAGWPHTGGPVLLAWRGAPPGRRPAVALVGARRASGYGTGVTAWLAEAAARVGVHVISGGALGIDAAAHRAAVDEPGGTSVVLGAGHSVAYPRPHAVPGGLFEQVLASGGSLISELLPDAKAHASNVRARNRIVAGLADAVVVVEGSERSGSLITAGDAADRGVQVLAVPGDVRAAGSAAPHRLLAEGAAPCTGPGDLLDAVGAACPSDPEEGRRPAPAVPAGLPDDLAKVLAASWPRPLRIEDLAARTGRPTGSLLAAITRARVAGILAESSEGVRLRSAPGR